MNSISRFIVIDDDPVNNLLCRMSIKKSCGETETITFVEPETGIEYLKQEYAHMKEPLPTVLLLDINMPTMTGWEFLDLYDKLNENVKQQIQVFILSSSVDQRDTERAFRHKNVVDYIVKPLTPKVIVSKLLREQDKVA